MVFDSKIFCTLRIILPALEIVVPLSLLSKLIIIMECVIERCCISIIWRVKWYLPLVRALLANSSSFSLIYMLISAPMRVIAKAPQQMTVDRRETSLYIYNY